MPDDDIAASRYEIIDDALMAAGLDWYEVSSWSRPGGECRHNIAYWRSDDWWGIGPGAHGHVDGVRWWNAKHPRTYADALAAGVSPEGGREVLASEEMRVESLMLVLRMRDALASNEVHDEGWCGRTVDAGLIDAAALADGRVILTRDGRLFADRLVRELIG
jgi:coproporphyrinogen III oxidase-like Fe-S oxidoreductase